MQIDLTGFTYDFKTCGYKNDAELTDIIIKLYQITSKKLALQEKEEKILLFYIKYGYNEKTKKAILTSVDKRSGDSAEKITRKHLDMINFSLKEKGYLLNHPSNYRQKLVDPTLEKMYKTFAGDNGNKLFIIGLKQN